MSDVIETLSRPCEGNPCKRPNTILTDREWLKVDGKYYHKGCKPTEKEQEATRQSST
jgi:hypothetical protein